MESDDTPSNGKHMEQYTNEQSAAQRPKDASQFTDPPAVPDRYAALNLAQDETYIYDQGDPEAWIQSDTARSLEQIA